VFCIVVVVIVLLIFCDGDSEMVVTLITLTFPSFRFLFRSFALLLPVSCTVLDISRRSIKDREMKLQFTRKSLLNDSRIPTRICSAF